MPWLSCLARAGARMQRSGLWSGGFQHLAGGRVWLFGRSARVWRGGVRLGGQGVGNGRSAGCEGVARAQAKATRATAFGWRKGSKCNRRCTQMRRAARRVISVSVVYKPMSQNRLYVKLARRAQRRLFRVGL